MIRISLLALLPVMVVLLLAAASDSPPVTPQFTKDSQLLRPDDYREWVFLSSDYETGLAQSPDHPPFTNVFVPQWAYRAFLNSGQWPDKTMFVFEWRSSDSTAPLIKNGRYQGDQIVMGVEVRDENRFPEKWGYFMFKDNAPATAKPKAACWQCHEDHAAVEHSFVQFYPTLKPVAQKFGTYKQAADKPAQ